MYKRKIKYTTVSVSEELMKEIKEHINKFNYISVADFLRIAVKDRIKIDNNPDEMVIHTPTLELKPTLDNMQDQLNKMQKDIEELIRV